MTNDPNNDSAQRETQEPEADQPSVDDREESEHTISTDSSENGNSDTVNPAPVSEDSESVPIETTEAAEGSQTDTQLEDTHSTSEDRSESEDDAKTIHIEETTPPEDPSSEADEEEEPGEPNVTDPDTDPEETSKIGGEEEEDTTDSEVTDSDTDSETTSEHSGDDSEGIGPTTDEAEPVVKPYDLKNIDHELRPTTDISYLRVDSENWLATNGQKAAASYSGVPVQGLEIGVLSTRENIEETVIAIFTALNRIYNDRGDYPRFRIIRTETAFNETSEEDVGLVAVFHPRSTEFDTLTKHIDALQENPSPEVYSPNRRRAVSLILQLATALQDEDLLYDDNIDDMPKWESANQIDDTVIFERYAPLGGEKLYDTTLEEDTLDDQAVDDLEDLPYDPQYAGSVVQNGLLVRRQED